MKVEIEIEEYEVLTSILIREQDDIKNMLDTQGIRSEDYNMYINVLAAINILLEFYGD